MTYCPSDIEMFFLDYYMINEIQLISSFPLSCGIGSCHIAVGTEKKLRTQKTADFSHGGGRAWFEAAANPVIILLWCSLPTKLFLTRDCLPNTGRPLLNDSKVENDEWFRYCYWHWHCYQDHWFSNTDANTDFNFTCKRGAWLNNREVENWSQTVFGLIKPVITSAMAGEGHYASISEGWSWRWERFLQNIRGAFS